MNETFVDHSFSMPIRKMRNILSRSQSGKRTMVERDFKDDIGEMDGDMLYRIWKLKMLFLERVDASNMQTKPYVFKLTK